MKVYGPYTNKEGRQFVILVYEDGSKKTKSYPKFLVEQKLGVELDEKTQTIDHINRNKNDHDFSNLVIKDRSTHIKDDVKRVKLVSLICPWCGISFERHPRVAARNKRQGKAGPFCSRKCGAIYGRELQLGRINKFENTFAGLGSCIITRGTFLGTSKK